VEACFFKRNPEERTVMEKIFSNEKGIALLTSLLLSLGVMIMVLGVMYFITQSTTMSGAGKRYATASEAADGAVEAAKDDINQAMWGNTAATMFNGSVCFASAMTSNDSPCTSSVTLPGTGGGNFNASITVVRLYSVAIPGGRLEFARSNGGAPSMAVYFRITATVTGSGNSKAENSVLYRFTG
jgi:uncharacterized protein (UPF0333 family)